MLLAGDAYKGNAIEVGAGIFYHVTGNVGLNLLGKYGVISSDNHIIDNQNRLYIGLGISSYIF